jgi:hypothetical protein
MIPAAAASEKAALRFGKKTIRRYITAAMVTESHFGFI